MNRVNVDKLGFLHDAYASPYYARGGDPAPFTAGTAEVSRELGARKLFCAVAELRCGQHYHPYHWHTAQEELFFVISGTPSIRVPHGTFTLRSGDVMAFPTGASGAHRLFNDADKVARVLLVANHDPNDMCYYPDTRKVMLGDPGPVVRATL